MSVPDYPLEETIDFKFTSRTAAGVPTTLSGGAVEIYEDNSATQITTAETLTADFDSVTGLNNLRIVATTANGFESGKSYQAVMSAGTVGGVSVVGEVVAQFSIERSSAFARLGAPAGASVSADVAAVKAETALIVADTNELQTDWADGGRLDVILDARASQTTVDNIETDTQDIQTQVGVAGAGLTAINLPDQAMNITGNITGNVSGSVGSVTGAVGSVTAAVTVDTISDGAIGAAAVADIFSTTAITEAYGTDGSAHTVAQILYLVLAHLGEHANAGTTKTLKQLDGSTTAATFTYDDGDNPTSITRAT